MASWWESESESETDDTQDESFPPEVDSSFTKCIYSLKWKLYETVVLGPELKTPEAQHNGLLQKYISHLDKLYEVMDKVLRNTFLETDLRSFPAAHRHEIVTCTNTLKSLTRKVSNVADVIPYREFLHEILRVYPFVHRGNSDVEQS